MIVIQETFVCRPGKASTVAKMMKAAMSGYPEVKNILTDMTGDFNRVIVVSEYESLTAYEASWNRMMENTEEMKKMEEIMKGFHDMYVSGGREIYRAW